MSTTFMQMRYANNKTYHIILHYAIVLLQGLWKIDSRLQSLDLVPSNKHQEPGVYFRTIWPSL